MKRWKRPLRHLVIFGLLGVVMSYAVAIGLPWISSGGHARADGPVGATVNDGLTAVWWVEQSNTLPADYLTSQYEQGWVADLNWAHGLGLSADDALPNWARGVVRRPQDTVGALNGKPYLACQISEQWERYGFPCRCLMMSTRDAAAYQINVVTPGSGQQRVEDETLYAGVLFVPEIPWNFPFNLKGRGALIPWQPIWPGLLLNTAFYGGILWVLWLTPGMIRRGVRRRRGLCVRCGYDLRGAVPGGHGAAPCPECGGTSR